MIIEIHRQLEGDERGRTDALVEDVLADRRPAVGADRWAASQTKSTDDRR